jgi:hypothetical protein
MRLEVEVKNGVPTLKSMVPRDDEVQSYISEAATKRGIDPKVALEVWGREGKGAWQSNASKGGRREPSWGPFQLLVGGDGTGYPTGLGNKFKETTGLDPSDPKNWRATVDFALDEVQKGGWQPWYGAKAAGITGFEGVAGAPASFTPGGGLTNMGGQFADSMSVLPPSVATGSPTQFERKFGTMPPPILPPRQDRLNPKPFAPPADMTGGVSASLDQIIASLVQPKVGANA